MRCAPAVGPRNDRSAASEPLAKEGVEYEWPVLVVASDVAFVSEEAFECVLEGAAGDSVFVGYAAAGGCLAVGEREQHDPLDSAEAIPDGLVGIAGLGEREVDGGCREVLGLVGPVEQVVKVVREQDCTLRMSATNSDSQTGLVAR